MTPTIYLDSNATTPLLPEAWDAMHSAQFDSFGNPSSSHHVGRQARRLLEDAREKVAHLLGAFPDEVLFTSGATEANNLAIRGLVGSVPGHLLASAIEHPCVIEPLKQLSQAGHDLEWLPVTTRGHLETATVISHVRESTRLVCLMLVNHETGVIQPVRHVAKKLPKTVALHCDAAQAVGKLPVNFHDLSVTTLTASAHKFRGPKGVGLLLVRRGAKLQPLLFGGHQQRGLRPGTEPVALAIGLAVALEFAVQRITENLEKLGKWKELLLEQIREALPNEGDRQSVVINGPRLGDPDGLPTTLNLSFPGCRADVLLARLDLAGVACSTGSACSSGSLLPSPVIQAMGVPDDILTSAIRFSLSPELTESEIREAAARIGKCVREVRQPGG